MTIQPSKAVLMSFPWLYLQINHPLDCPICDQGGECDLQEQVGTPCKAVAYLQQAKSCGTAMQMIAFVTSQPSGQPSGRLQPLRGFSVRQDPANAHDCHAAAQHC